MVSKFRVVIGEPIFGGNQHHHAESIASQHTYGELGNILILPVQTSPFSLWESLPSQLNGSTLYTTEWTEVPACPTPPWGSDHVCQWGIEPQLL